MLLIPLGWTIKISNLLRFVVWFAFKQFLSDIRRRDVFFFFWVCFDEWVQRWCSLIQFEFRSTINDSKPIILKPISLNRYWFLLHLKLFSNFLDIYSHHTEYVIDIFNWARVLRTIKDFIGSHTCKIKCNLKANWEMFSLNLSN